MSNMNPTNMQDMASHMQAPQAGDQQFRTSEFILNHLRKQPIPSGWQSTVRLEERREWVTQIETAFRLMTQHHDQLNNPQMNSNCIGNALNFESNYFKQSISRQQYQTSLGIKLNQIRVSRQKMVDGMIPNSGQMQQGMVPAVGGPNTNPMNVGYNALPQGVVPQFQQQMQPSPVVLQQHSALVEPSPQSGDNQRKMATMINQTPQQSHPQQVISQAPPKAIPQMSGEQMQISQLATILQRKAHEDGTVNQIREYLLKMPMEKLQQMRNARIDPLQYHFRQQAVHVFQQKKARDQAQLASKHPGQVSDQSPQYNLLTTGLGQGMLAGNPGYNFSQFVGQQADAQRSQDAGHLVVPASNHQALNGQFGRPGLLGGSQDAAIGTSTQALNPMAQHQQQLAMHQAQRENVQHGLQPGQVDAQTQSKVRNLPKAANAATLLGQIGGLDTSQLVQQPSPAMPVLNQPLGTPRKQGNKTLQQSAPKQPNVQQHGSHPISQTPQPQPQRSFVNQRQPGMMNPNSFKLPPNLPSQLRARLAVAPPDKMRALIEGWQQESATDQTPAPIVATQAQIPQRAPKKRQPLPQGQQADMLSQSNDQRFLRPTSMQIMTANGASVGEPQQRQPTDQKATPLPGSINGSRIEQGRMMEAMPLPRPYLKQAYPNVIFPEQLQNWAHLRKWMEQNPSAIPQDNRLALQNLQSAQWQNLRQRAQNVGAQAPGPINDIAQPQLASQGIPPSIANHGERQDWFQAGIVHMVAGMPQLRPVNIHDINEFRQKIGPQPTTTSDQDLGKYLMADRLSRVRRTNPQLAEQIVIAHQRRRQQPADLQQHMNSKNDSHDLPAMDPQATRMPNDVQTQFPSQSPALGMMPRAPFIASTSALQRATGQGQGTPSHFYSQTQSLQHVPDVTGPHVPGATGAKQEQPPRPTPQPRVQMEAQIKTALGHQPRPQFETMHVTNPTASADSAASRQHGLTSNEKDMRFQHLVQSVNFSTPRGPPIPLSQDHKTQMTAKRNQFLPLIQQVKKFIRPFYNKFGEENLIMDVARCITVLEQQCFIEGAQELTIRPFELENILKKMAAFSRAMQARAANGGHNASNLPTQQSARGVLPSAPALQAPVPPRKHQEKVQATKMERKPSQKRNNNSKNTASTKQAPIPVGSASPNGQGTPIYANVDARRGFALKEPPHKRAKPNNKSASAASTPAAQVITPGPQSSPQVGKISKLTPPSHQMHEPQPPVMVDLPFKCPIPGCDYETEGFTTQNELDKHTKSVHDYSGDALEFCLRNMRKALGLEKPAVPIVTASLSNPPFPKAKALDKGTSISARPKAEPTTVDGDILKMEIPTKPKSEPTTVDRDVLKMEIPTKPKSEPITTGGDILKKEIVTPASTPMSRPPTQNGTNTATPAESVLKTPQAGIKVETPESSTAGIKRAPTQNMKAVGTQNSTNKTPVPAPAPAIKKHDPWAKSSISQETIHAIFSGMPNVNSPFFYSPTASTPGDTPDSGEDSNPSPDSEPRFKLEEWNPFPEITGEFIELTGGLDAMHVDLGNDEMAVDEEEWAKMDFAQRYGPTTGLEKDDPILDTKLFAAAWRASGEAYGLAEDMAEDMAVD